MFIFHFRQYYNKQPLHPHCGLQRLYKELVKEEDNSLHLASVFLLQTLSQLKEQLEKCYSLPFFPEIS